MNAMSGLMDPSINLQFLQRQQIRIKAPNTKIAASMFIKRYAKDYLDEIMNEVLWGKQMNIIPLQACFVTEELNLQIDIEKVSEARSREEWWDQLFSHHLTRVVLAMHETTNLPLIISWENIAVRLNSLLRKAVQNYPEYEQDVIIIAKELQGLKGEAFGQPSNPLVRYLTAPTDLTRQKIRSTCCYYHKLEKDKPLPYCLVCPVKV